VIFDNAPSWGRRPRKVTVSDRMPCHRTVLHRSIRRSSLLGKVRCGIPSERLQHLASALRRRVIKVLGFGWQSWWAAFSKAADLRMGQPT
jgi:hypothetical protein